MKLSFKPVLLLFTIVTLISCNKKANKFSIEGITEDASGKMISLYHLTGKDRELIDSVKIDSQDKFIVKGEINDIGIYQLLLQGLSIEEKENERTTSIHLIIKPKDKIEIHSKLGSFGINYVVYGSEESKRVQKVISEQYKTMEEITQLSEIYYNARNNHHDKLDSIKASLDSTYAEVTKKHKQFSIDLIEEDYGSMANIMILSQRLGIRQSVFSPVNDIELFMLVDSALRQNYPEADPVKELNTEVERIKQYLDAQERQNELLGIGKTPPEIALPNPEGDTILLSSTRGKIVLLDFWASWCGPCRQENPYLVEAYKKFKQNGFEIYQVSLDKTAENWTGAIEQQHLTWINVSDLKYYDSPVARTYNIQKIPTNFLLDREGKIIATDLRGDQLNEKLTSIFNSEK